mmetsp:Transcript_1370/g.5890  ORF Transcript_1370/g.5890 Transcript_1370/m.5890 type:complete len:412 (-) Transcript_1370:313-1548(-)|eukprot:scaffold90_cov264-Pinguiococcus_pyrenoidosus.AAC.25
MGVLLTRAHEEDRLAGLVAHRQGRSHLVVDGVKLGQNDAVDLLERARRCVVRKRLVEHHQLVDAIVADQSFSHEDRELRSIVADELAERLHERLVVLHPPGRVHQQHIVLVLASMRLRRAGHRRRVAAVSPLEQVHLEAPRVGPQLLHRPGPEGIARGDERPASVGLEEVGDLGQRGALSDAVDANEDHREDLAAALGLQDLPKHVGVLARREHVDDRLLQGRLHEALDPLEVGHALPNQRLGHRGAEVLRDLDGHVLRHQHVLHAVHDAFEVLFGEAPATGQGLEEGRESPRARGPVGTITTAIAVRVDVVVVLFEDVDVLFLVFPGGGLSFLGKILLAHGLVNVLVTVHLVATHVQLLRLFLAEFLGAGPVPHGGLLGTTPAAGGLALLGAVGAHATAPRSQLGAFNRG